MGLRGVGVQEAWRRSRSDCSPKGAVRPFGEQSAGFRPMLPVAELSWCGTQITAGPPQSCPGARTVRLPTRGEAALARTD